MSIFQDGGCGRSILFPVSHLLMSLYSKGQNLSANQISRLFPVSKNKSSPYWNTTSGFYLDHIAIIDVLFCIRLPNFVQIGPPTAVIWRHIDFATWRSPPLNTISGFVFVDVSAFRTSVPISKPNFVDISPFTAGLEKQTSTSGFDLDHFAVIGMLFCIRLPNFVQIGPPSALIWRHYITYFAI